VKTQLANFWNQKFGGKKKKKGMILPQPELITTHQESTHNGSYVDWK
jgi:hypothetical protein